MKVILQKKNALNSISFIYHKTRPLIKIIFYLTYVCFIIMNIIRVKHFLPRNPFNLCYFIYLVQRFNYKLQFLQYCKSHNKRHKISYKRSTIFLASNYQETSFVRYMFRKCIRSNSTLIRRFVRLAL